MSKSSQTSSISLLSGDYQGRFIDVSFGTEKSEGSSAENVHSILVLIEDRLFSLRIQEKIKLSKGALISFEVTEEGVVENVKIEKSAVNFDVEGDLLRWRRPANNPSRMELLRTRHQIILGIREWFDQQNFIETETPALVFAPSPETQLVPMKTDSGFLITSPEFQMKRLLVGGFEKIFQLARCFRNAESGPLHNPEFTMLEWYRTHEPLEMLMKDIEQLVMHLRETVSAEYFSKHIPLPPWPRKTVSELFKEHLDIFLDGTETVVQLRKKAQLAGYDKLLVDTSVSNLTDSLAYEQIFFQLWNHVEAKLVVSSPVFVHDWPLHLASLARQSPEHPGFAERVEFYADGMELANGFRELTDASEQRRRFKQDMKNRESEGREAVPLDEKFLSCLEQGLPESSGMALGVDRLIMWLCGAQNIQEVLCFSQGEV